MRVEVASCAGSWLVDVTDGSTDRSTVPAVDRGSAMGGLGLRLIARLSAAVGWAVVGRTSTWACLVPAAQAHR